MNIDVELSKLDMTEPVIARWALHRIDNFRETDEEQAREMEDFLFTDDVITGLLKDNDILFLRLSLIQTLRPAKFKNLIPQLSTIWREEAQGHEGKYLAGVIAENDPAAAADLFYTFCSQGAHQFEDYLKWQGVYNSLSKLDDAQHKTIADLMIRAFEDEGPGPDTDPFIPEIMILMWRYDHPRLESVVKDFIRNVPSKASGQSYSEKLTAVADMLGIASSEYWLIMDHLEGLPAPELSEISEFYRSLVPIEDLDLVIRDIRRRSFSSVRRFLLENQSLIIDERVRGVWQSLLNDEKLISKLHKKKHRPFFFALLLSALTSSIRVTDLALESLSLERVCHLLTVDVESVPDINAFVRYFGKVDRLSAVTALTGALDRMAESGKGYNALIVISEFKYEEFIEPLTRVLLADNVDEYLYESIFRTFVAFGDRVIDFFETCFSELPWHAQVSIMGITAKIGGEKAVAFFKDHFDDCMAVDRRLTLASCEDLVCRFCLEKILPKVNKGQKDIDDTYMMISLLNGVRTPAIQELLDGYYQREQDQVRVMASLEAGDIISAFKPTIDLELKCRQCGDVNVYSVKRVIVGRTGDSYIAQEIECINCGKSAEFDITLSGSQKISMEMMRLMAISSPDDTQKAMELTPLEMQGCAAFGKEMSVNQAIETYKQKIVEEPDNPEYHIGLGNIYHYVDKWADAVQCLEKAVALDPGYIEACYTLAEIADCRGDADNALAWMKKGVPLLKSMKLMKYTTIDPDFFKAEYINFYNELIVRTGGLKNDMLEPMYIPPAHYEPPPEPYIRKEGKIGRNDPCPCGSGKKYKKCCLNKE